MCCGKFATTQYFFKKYCVVTNLPQHIIFSKNVVLRTWRTIIFFEKKCVVAEKNKVADTCHHIEGPVDYKIWELCSNRLRAWNKDSWIVTSMTWPAGETASCKLGSTLNRTWRCDWSVAWQSEIMSLVRAGGGHFEHMLWNYCSFVLCGSSEHFIQVLCSSWDGRPFGHSRHGPKIGELDPHVTQCGLVRGLSSYQVASWSIQPFGHNKHGPKNGGLCLFLGGGAGWSGPTRSQKKCLHTLV